MLALAHPYDPASEVSHRAPSSSSVSRQRQSRKPSSAPSSSALASSSRQPSSSSVPFTAAASSSSSRPHSASQQQSQPLAAPTRQQQLATNNSPSQISPKVVTEPLPTTSGSVDIHSYPSADLLRLLASLLTQIAAANDKLDSSASSAALAESHSSPFAPPSPSVEHAPFWRTLFTASRSALSTSSSTLTFHARNIPTITLEAYLLRILKYCPTTNEVFLSLLVYFDRMSKLSADATGRTFVIDSYNIHRLVIAGVTVASKFFSDVFYTNSRYAKVGGLPLAELNQLELQFLLLNDFRLVIPKDEMQRYAEQLILFSTSSSPASSQTNGVVTPSSAASSSTTSIIRPPLAVQPQTPSTAAAPTPSLASSSTSLASSSGSSTVVPNGGTPTNSTTSLQTYPTSFSSSALESSETQSSRMHAMGAIDAYGGRIPGASTTSTPLKQPQGPYSSFPSTLHPSDNVTMQREYSTYSRGPSQNGSASHVNGMMMKTPRRASDASSVYSAYSEASSEADTETETETETDGGWTTDDEPTIKAPGGSVSSAASIASGDSACGDSVYGGSDGKRGSVSSFDDQDEDVRAATDSSGRRRNYSLSTGDESDDEREDGDASMECEDERIGGRVDVEMDVERTPDSERVWRRGGAGQGQVWRSR